MLAAGGRRGRAGDGRRGGRRQRLSGRTGGDGEEGSADRREEVRRPHRALQRCLRVRSQLTSALPAPLTGLGATPTRLPAASSRRSSSPLKGILVLKPLKVVKYHKDNLLSGILSFESIGWYFVDTHRKEWHIVLFPETISSHNSYRLDLPRFK